MWQAKYFVSFLDSHNWWFLFDFLLPRFQNVFQKLNLNEQKQKQYSFIAQMDIKYKILQYHRPLTGSGMGH